MPVDDSSLFPSLSFSLSLLLLVKPHPIEAFTKNTGDISSPGNCFWKIGSVCRMRSVAASGTPLNDGDEQWSLLSFWWERVSVRRVRGMSER